PLPSVIFTLSLHAALPIYRDTDNPVCALACLQTWNLQARLPAHSRAMSALVQLVNVSKRYADAVALQPTNLSVECSKTTVLIGPDRKSTRLNSSHVSISYA